MANQPPDPPAMNVTHGDDGLLFELRDEVFMLVKWHSPTQLRAELWRKDQLLPPDIGNLYTSSFRSRLAKAAREHFGDKNVPHILDDIDDVARALSQPTSNRGTLHNTLEETAGPSVTERLIAYARKSARFFHTPERRAYAAVTRGDHTENYSVASRDFRLWLRQEFWEQEKRRLEDAIAESGGALLEGEPVSRDPEPIREQALLDAVRQLEAVALFSSPERQVYVRVAGYEGGIYIDLANEQWTAVRISREGWEIVSDPPVRFIRPAGVAEIPDPKAGDAEAANTLRRLLNMSDDEEGEKNWRLILAWLAQAFLPTGPYPVLTLLGPQGAAKSTAARIIRSIVDPSSVALRSAPRDEHNLYIDSVSSWVITLDNLNTLPPWLSDALCRLATGGGFSTRTLYTDRDQELFDAMRPVILNGIGDVVARPDLLDRALIINLPQISKESRRLERKIYAELEEAMPGIMGYIFDAIVQGLNAVDEVRLPGLPRMADFARWGVATERGLGGAEGSFMEAYEESQAEGVQTALESWPIVAPLLGFAMLHKGEVNAWIGTATELLDILNERPGVSDELKRAREWPKAPNALTAQLNRLAPSLREVGVIVDRPSGSHKAGRLRRVFYEGDDKRPSPSSPPSPELRNSSKTGGYEGDDPGDDPFMGDDPLGVEDDPRFKTVPREYPIDKPKGDGGDGGDGDTWEELFRSEY